MNPYNGSICMFHQVQEFLAFMHSLEDEEKKTQDARDAQKSARKDTLSLSTNKMCSTKCWQKQERIAIMKN